MKSKVNALPIVDRPCQELNWVEGSKTFFKIRHSNGDYLISLNSVLACLWYIQWTSIQKYYEILPPIENKWWEFLGITADKYFFDDYLAVPLSFLGTIERVSDFHNTFLIELTNIESHRHTMSFGCLVSILFVCCRILRILPAITLTDKFSTDSDWFNLANSHLHIPFLTKGIKPTLEISAFLTEDDISAQAVACEYFHTEDLQNG